MDIQYQLMGQRIQMRRKEMNMKQSELARQLGISNNHMSSIENGREHSSLDRLLRICGILRITPDFLLLGNMHANDIPQDIMDGLRLCREEDIDVVRKLVEFLILRNPDNKDQELYI